MRTTSGCGRYLVDILYAEKLFIKLAMTVAWQTRTGQTYLHANISSRD